MPSVVEQHHKLEYATNVQMVAQQTKNPLAGAVTEVPANGEAKSVSDLLNSVEYLYGEERSRRNVENPISGSRRWLVRPQEIKSGQYIDDEDKYDTARDPTSDFVRGHTMAVNRGWADRILGIRKQGSVFVVADGGIMGKALEGKTPGGATTDLPAGQTIVHGGTGLTLDKLRAAKLKLEKADFGLEDMDQLYCVITPTQKDNLIALAAASGPALNAFQIQQIQDGKPTSLLGINWIFTNRLPLAGTTRSCPLFSKANIVAGVWSPIKGDMWNDTSADNLPYVKVAARMACTRVQDAGVVVIECTE